jgi:hypothetical protein
LKGQQICNAHGIIAWQDNKLAIPMVLFLDGTVQIGNTRGIIA